MKFIKLGLVAAALMTVSGVSLAQQKDIKIVDPRESPYVISPNGVVVMNPFGLCWRTGFWSLERARTTKVEGSPFPVGCVCDKALMPKEVCEPPPPPPPPPAPPPPPPPPPPPAPTSEKVTFAADALFDFDKATLKPEGRAKMDDLVSKLAGVSLEVIIAVGYTDRIGSDAYNLKLSQRRAQAVKDYLVSKGIEPNRVYTEGKGEANPVKQCADPSAKGEIRNQKQLIDVLAAEPARRGRSSGYTTGEEIIKTDLPKLSPASAGLFFCAGFSANERLRNIRTMHDNVDRAELHKFSELAAKWWDREGPMRPLHDINPARLEWIDRLASLSGKRVLDVGCGGGVLTEAMAQKSASVTGIDLADKPLQVARLHALDSKRSCRVSRMRGRNNGR